MTVSSNHTQQTIRYWRQSLIDSDKIGFDKKKTYEILGSENGTQSLSQSSIDRLFNEYKDYRARLEPLKDKKYKDAPENFDHVPILYVPFVGRHIDNRGKETIAAPLSVEATLTEGGCINITPESIPYFNPEYIEPYTKEGFSFGITREQLDNAISAVGLIPTTTNPDNLQEYLDKILQHALGDQYKGLEFLEPYQETCERYVVLDLEQKGLSQSLIKTYQEILERDETPVLLKSVFKTPQNCIAAQTKENEERHCGHVSGEFPLNDGQRLALYAGTTLQDGEILAVTGPPGTGKTTLIGNAIASAWVAAALEESEAPVTFVTSTNNQAVQNALNSFPDIRDLPDDHPFKARTVLLERWVKDAGAFGTLFPSSTQLKKDETKKFLCVSRERGKTKWSGWICDLETPEQLDQRKAYYLECANKSVTNQNELTDISTAVQHVHALMEAAKKQLDNALTLKFYLEKFITTYPTDDLTSYFAERIETFTTKKELQVTGIRNSQKQLDQKQDTLGSYKTIARRAITLFTPLNLIEGIGSLFLKSYKQRRSARVIDFLGDQDLSAESWGFDTILTEPQIREHLSHKERSLKDTVKAAQNDLNTQTEALTSLEQKLQALQKQQSDYESLVERCRKLLCSIYPENAAHCESRLSQLKKTPSLILEEIDRYHRLLLFILASRYWEGRWLLELEVHSESKRNQNLYGSLQTDVEGFFRRISKLTPCLGSTLHTLPNLLQYFCRDTQSNPRLYNFLDMLIMDEAGQVATETGMVGLALAKKAMVIGDTDQIEPVRKFGEYQDARLMKQFGLIDMYEQFNENGLSISEGNMMHMAKAQTAASLDDKTQGMFLSDHWRCVPEIIGYCNTLVYQGRLKPRKPSADQQAFPPMGFAHVSSGSVKRGGSRCNPVEALAIAKWIKQNEEKLQNAYGDGTQPLKNIIGIVTPFAAQSNEIKQALKREGVDTKIQVGTVHRFQGGEKNMIIFSPVYGADDGVSSYFFDQGKNMLNVAVSRAKYSFLTFGDMRVFAGQSTQKPSGLLGQYLFADPNNEITDVEVPTRVKSTIRARCERIRTLEDHRQVLHEALTQSQTRLVITSAFLSINAIEDDDIIPLLGQAAGRGVEIRVLYDRAFNRDKAIAHKAIMAFQRAGLTIHGVWGIHYKTLAYDDDFYIDGSFNWLSAQRNQHSIYHHQEGSILVRGSEAKEWIDQTWAEATDFIEASKT